jgi:hypothetical protein
MITVLQHPVSVQSVHRCERTPIIRYGNRTEIRCLAVGKARVNSTVPCTPILTIGLRIDGPDDINSPVLQGPSTLYTLQQFIIHSTSAAVLKSWLSVFNPMAQGARHGTVHPCLVHSKAPDLSPWQPTFCMNRCIA